MDYKKIVLDFAHRIDSVKGKLNLATKTDVVRGDVLKIADDMEKALSMSDDEMFYAAIYNARATIMTAPENCSVSQLKEALGDGAEELRLLSAYFDN